MKRYITIVLYLIATTSADKKCHGIYFNERYYDIQILKEGINRIHKLVLNNNDNVLYFTYNELSQVPTMKLGYMNLNTNASGVIEGVRNATAIAVDPARNVVYVGGLDGIYTINQNKIPIQISNQGNIQSLFYKDALYFTNKRKEAYRNANGFINAVPELQGIEVDDLVLDDDNNILFIQNNKLFRLKLGTRAINSHERYTVDLITTDGNLKPYVHTNDGVFVYNKYKYALDKVSNLRNLKALTFNQMIEPIYVVSDVIVKLKFNPIPCHEF